MWFCGGDQRADQNRRRLALAPPIAREKYAVRPINCRGMPSRFSSGPSCCNKFSRCPNMVSCRQSPLAGMPITLASTRAGNGHSKAPCTSDFAPVGRQRRGAIRRRMRRWRLERSDPPRVRPLVNAGILSCCGGSTFDNVGHPRKTFARIAGLPWARGVESRFLARRRGQRSCPEHGRTSVVSRHNPELDRRHIKDAAVRAVAAARCSKGFPAASGASD